MEYYMHWRLKSASSYYIIRNHWSFGGWNNRLHSLDFMIGSYLYEYFWYKCIIQHIRIHWVFYVTTGSCGFVLLLCSWIWSCKSILDCMKQFYKVRKRLWYTHRPVSDLNCFFQLHFCLFLPSFYINTYRVQWDLLGLAEV